MAEVTVPLGLPCLNCGKTVSASSPNTCPKCKELGIKDSVFCDQKCFVANWKKHRTLHQAPVSETKTDTFVYPPGTHDAFEGKYAYTGELRAVYPDVEVPKREVPPEIPRPDYAIEARGISFSERASDRLGRQARILTKAEIKGMRAVCRIAREVLEIAAAAVRPGITTLEIDELVHAETIKRGAYPSPLGYHLFPRSVCTSINEAICHGIPDARPLLATDIVNLDVTCFYKGFHGDVNATYLVSDAVPDVNQRLVKCARDALDEAIRACKPGAFFKDLGGIIEGVCKDAGFQVNKTYCGHGINQLFHTGPDVIHYANNRAAGAMKAGMTFTIEPMVTAGHHKEVHWPDNWTAVTNDGKASAQFEETLLITETGVEVLTSAPGWKLPKKSKK